MLSFVCVLCRHHEALGWENDLTPDPLWGCGRGASGALFLCLHQLPARVWELYKWSAAPVRTSLERRWLEAFCTTLRVDTLWSCALSSMCESSQRYWGVIMIGILDNNSWGSGSPLGGRWHLSLAIPKMLGLVDYLNSLGRTSEARNLYSPQPTLRFLYFSREHGHLPSFGPKGPAFAPNIFVKLSWCEMTTPKLPCDAAVAEKR